MMNISEIERVGKDVSTEDEIKNGFIKTNIYLSYGLKAPN